MEQNKIHMDLVKKQLKQIFELEERKNRNFRNEMGHAELDLEKGDQFLREYQLFRKIDPEYDSMIGAYYFDCYWFYYIEKIKGKFILTRHIDKFERKTILQDDELVGLESHEDDIGHIFIIGTCYLVDFYKKRLGL